MSLPRLLAACLALLTTVAAADTTKEIHLANLRQLTSDGDNGEAYFSWDGAKLVWQTSREGLGCDKIWTMNADGTGKTRVGPGQGAQTCAFFVPGDREIVFSSTHERPEACPPRPEVKGAHFVWPLWPYDIYRADADGGNLKKLTDNPGYDAEPVVSSDGRRIVFGSLRDGDFDVYAMDMDGGNVTRLTDAVGYDGGPWWSPDGTKIVWRAFHPKTEEEKRFWAACVEGSHIVPMRLELWVMNADGTGKRQLTDNGATNWSPSWHPDGKRIVFSSNMDDWRPDLNRFGHNFELYLMNLDGTGLERLTFNNTFDSFPMFSPDGKRLAFASNRTPERPRQTDIFLADWVE